MDCYSHTQGLYLWVDNSCSLDSSELPFAHKNFIVSRLFYLFFSAVEKMCIKTKYYHPYILFCTHYGTHLNLNTEHNKCHINWFVNVLLNVDWFAFLEGEKDEKWKIHVLWMMLANTETSHQKGCIVKKLTHSPYVQSCCFSSWSDFAVRFSESVAEASEVLWKNSLGCAMYSNMLWM